jgi:NCS1 family nucleobase:cation symporter-1
MCPWALVSGATVFISVMSGYATFLAPMTGIMLADYIVVRRQNVKLSGLYECHPGAPYYYWKGVNLRAAAAWVLAVIPSFPGFLASVSTTQVPDALHKIYYLCWPRKLSCLPSWASAKTRADYKSWLYSGRWTVHLVRHHLSHREPLRGRRQRRVRHFRVSWLLGKLFNMVIIS